MKPTPRRSRKICARLAVGAATGAALFAAALAVGPSAGCGPGPTPAAASTDAAAAGDSGDSGDGGPGSSAVAQAIDGFDLPVKDGSWWEFSSDSSGSYNGDTGSASFHNTATFVLQLGAATTIAGDQAFPVQVTTLASDPAGDYKFGFKYLSFVGKRIRGSADGATYTVLFDANTGLWPATNTGMFGEFPDAKGTRKAVQQPLDGGASWLVGEANSSQGCETIPPYGTLCGASSDISNNANEVYAPGIGIVSSRYSGSTSNTSGSSQRTDTTNLIDASVTGDRPAPTRDAGPDSGPGCVDISVPLGTNLQATAAAGSPPASSGGVLPDGYYVATAIRVYGTGKSAGTVTGTFAGDIKVAAPRFEIAYASSVIQGSYYASGTFTVSGATVNVANACSSSGTGPASYGYSVTGPTTVDFTAPLGTYTAVTTYTKQ